MFNKINNYASRSAIGASGAASNQAAHVGLTLGGIYAAPQSNANINSVLKTMTDPVPAEIHGVNGCTLEGICHTNPFKDDVIISARIDFNGAGGAPRKVPTSAELKKAVAAANGRVIAGVNTHLDVSIKQMNACLPGGSQKGFWSAKHKVLKVKNPDAVDVILESSGVYAGKNIFSAPPELPESNTSDIFGQSMFLGRPKAAIGSESALPGNGVNAGNVAASIVLPKGGAFHSKSHVRLQEQSNGPTLVIPAKQPSEENTPQYVMDIINQQAPWALFGEHDSSELAKPVSHLSCGQAEIGVMAVTIHKDNEATLITGQALEDLVRKIILSAAEETRNTVDPVKLKHTLIQLMRDGATSEQANSLGLEKGETLAMITEAVARVLIRDHDWGAEDLNQIKIYANSGDKFFDPSTVENFKNNGIFRHASSINIDGQLIADERKRISGL